MRSRWKHIAWVPALCALVSGAPRPAQAAPTGPRPDAAQTTAASSRAARAKPLDVRRGETYDGRPQPSDPHAPLRAVPRVVFFVPRAAAALVSRTSVAVVDWLERSGAVEWVRRIFWAYHGRLRILPVGGFRSDLTPQAGGTVRTDLLFGRARRAGLVAQGAYGDVHTFQARLQFHPLGLPLPGRPALHRCWHLRLDGGYESRDDAPFRGVGYIREQATLSPPAARFRREVAQTLAVTRVRLWRQLGLQLQAGFDWRRFSDGHAAVGADGRPFSEVFGTDWPGWDQGLGAFYADLRLHWGGRLGRLLPPRGVRARLGGAVWAGPDRTNRLLRLDARLEAFTALGGRTQRLGLRGQVAGIGGLQGQPVPLVYLPRLGGLRTMRGFVGGRFRGETVAWLAFEYYAALLPRLWLGLFLDWGGAWRERFGAHGWARIDVSGGGWLGLRIAPGFWVQLQVAGSREGPTVYVGCGTGG